MKKIKDLGLYEVNNEIYSLVPDYLNLKTISQKIVFIKKDLVLKYFQNHKGKENAMPLNKIAQSLNFSAKGNSLEFRHIVAKLVEEDKVPIVSSVKGYYMANEISDILQNIITEELRINGIQRRINALKYILENGKN